ncbi:MAG: 50S ribosomal protein L15 [Planctomycetales bacterium]|nr:50S ribosomal protein L15 [Planctomycetales bacterium]
MILNDVHRGIQKRKGRKRVGRGAGSGHGRTATRGEKGASSRSGHSRRLGFEGGQMPLFRRVAKRGFNNNFFSQKIAIVNIAVLDANFDDGETVDPTVLISTGIVKGRFEVIKILGNGALTKKLTVMAHQFSESAALKIVAAGGTAEKI